MPKTLSLLVTAALFGAVCLLSPSAQAGEAGPGPDAEVGAADATSSQADAPGDAANCIAVGQPCARGETCCNASAYCGSFGGATGSLVCGLDTPNQLSTGSCGVSGSNGDGVGASIIGALAMVVGAGVRRRRTRRRPT